jgi:cystathionine beta-lyase/cystathionine gamma-synthase
LRHILMAVSWGGHESLVLPKCAGMQPSAFSAGDPEHKMIRFYIGLEDAEYLINDIDQALSKV